MKRKVHVQKETEMKLKLIAAIVLAGFAAAPMFGQTITATPQVRAGVWRPTRLAGLLRHVQ